MWRDHAEGDLPEPVNYDGTYYSELNQFNDSGASGTAMLMLDGDQLTVEIEASGLTPDQTHLQHIHGFSDVRKPWDCKAQPIRPVSIGFVRTRYRGP